jgi:hypothetical protein
VPRDQQGGSKNWFRWSLNLRPLKFAAAAALAAWCFTATTPAEAQDVPWGQKGQTKKGTKKKKPTTPAKATAKPAAKATAKPAAKAQPAVQPGGPTEAPKAAPGEAPVEPTVDPAAPTKVELPPAQLLEHFKKELTPHGTWETSPLFGDVWIPSEASVGKEFAPYRDQGHWALTDKNEWAWVSDMSWGKIPFHYGAWTWSPEKNWMWVPGTQHAPAHVVWRVADADRQFVGWAPMAPTPSATATTEGEAPAAPKTVLPFYFVPTRYLFSPHLDKFVIANKDLAAKMHAHSHIFGGHAVAPGPDGDAPIDAATLLKAASPTLADVKVPQFALPKAKLPSETDAIAPVLVDKPADPPAEHPTEAAQAPTQDGPFATPPPEKVKRKVKRARTVRNVDGSRPRYRCWWTNTRPRIWRCGY